MFYLLTFFSGALQESILTRPAIVELRSLSFLFVFVWLVLFAWFKRNTSFFHQTSEPLIESVETKLKIENYPVVVEVVTVADVKSRAIKPQKKFFISCLLSVFLHQWWWKIMLVFFFTKEDFKDLTNVHVTNAKLTLLPNHTGNWFGRKVNRGSGSSEPCITVAALITLCSTYIQYTLSIYHIIYFISYCGCNNYTFPYRLFFSTHTPKKIVLNNFIDNKNC